MNKVLNRLLLSSFFTLLIVAFMIQPVVAWSDVGVEYFDDYYENLLIGVYFGLIFHPHKLP